MDSELARLRMHFKWNVFLSECYFPRQCCLIVLPHTCLAGMQEPRCLRRNLHINLPREFLDITASHERYTLTCCVVQHSEKGL